MQKGETMILKTGCGKTQVSYAYGDFICGELDDPDDNTLLCDKCCGYNQCYEESQKETRENNKPLTCLIFSHRTY